VASIDAIPGSDAARIPPAAKPGWLRSNWGVLLAVAALVTVILLPTPEGLSIAGQRMLAILAFAVIVWMTEALDYAVSAVVIAAIVLGESLSSLAAVGACFTLAGVWLASEPPGDLARTGARERD